MNDRIMRMMLGVLIASFFIFYNSALALIGILVYVSGIVGTCPLYSVIKINNFGKADRELS